MALWSALIFVLALPIVDAKHDSTQRLRAHSLSSSALFVQLGKPKEPSCSCVFDDTCSCEGALKFMECVKTACNSGECACIEGDGKNLTNHFMESCSAMQSECPYVGLNCAADESTCKVDDGTGNLQAVAWKNGAKKSHKQHVEKQAIEVKEDTVEVNKVEYIKQEKHEDTVQAVSSYGHRVFAQGIIITVLMLCLTIALVNSKNEKVSKSTWSILDFVVVTFLALAWFIVITHSFDYFKVAGWRKIALHCLVSIVVLFVSLLISFRLSSNKERADIFGGIFTPMVMWTNAGFVETVQGEFSSSALQVFAFLMIMVAYFAALLVFFHYVVKKMTRQKQHDDVENCMVGGALAGGFALWCHHLVTGTYSTIEASNRVPVSSFHAWMLNLLSVGFLVVAIVALRYLNPICKKMKEDETVLAPKRSYWKLRLCEIATVFFGHLPRFSFIMSLAHLVLDHMGYSKGSIGAQMLLALASTVVGIVLIVICAYVPYLNKDTDMSKELSGMFLGLGGFIVGAAWAGMLDNSISEMVKGENYSHPFVVKLAITSFMTAFVFPVYCYYLKPAITAALEDKKSPP